MPNKQRSAPRFSRVDWALMAAVASLLAGYLLRGLALYDRLVGLHY